MKKNLSILLLLLINTIIFADNVKQEEALDDLSLEELMNIKVYSATKSYQRIEEIPANITIITRKEIEKFNYTTLDELLKHVPGLFIIDDTEHFQIGSRGSLGSSFKLMINNNPISPLRNPRDGTSNRNYFATPIQSIDRIEIIKGPQAVTYGSNSMYGSINIITNDFNEKNIVSVGSGNNGQEQVFARVNHKNKNGGFTLNTSFYNTDGISGNLEDAFTKNYYTSRDVNAVKKLDGLLGNNYKTLDFSHRYKNLTTDITYSQTNYGFYLEPSYRKNEVEQIDKAIALTYEDDINNNLDYKINFINSIKDYAIDDMAMSYHNINGTNNYAENKRNQLDLHFNYKFNDKLKILLGVTYEGIEHNLNARYFTYSETKRFYDFNTKDIYSKLHYTLSDQFEFNTGVRYSLRDSFDINYYKNDNYEMGIMDERTDYLPEFSAIYHINTNNHLKFLYGKAYQQTYYSLNKFEEIESSEINYIYLSRKYQINSSVFYNKSSNISLFKQANTNFPTSDNSTQETKGFEFAVTYKPSYNYQIASSITLQDTKSMYEDLISIEPDFSPTLLAKIDMSYLYDKTRYSLLVSYIDKMKASMNYTTFERYGIDSKNNIDITVNVQHKFNKKLSANLHISNLFDKENNIPAGSTLTDFYNGAFTQGRIGTLTMSYSF